MNDPTGQNPDIRHNPPENQNKASSDPGKADAACILSRKEADCIACLDQPDCISHHAAKTCSRQTEPASRPDQKAVADQSGGFKTEGARADVSGSDDSRSAPFQANTSGADKCRADDFKADSFRADRSKADHAPSSRKMAENSGSDASADLPESSSAPFQSNDQLAEADGQGDESWSPEMDACLADFPMPEGLQPDLLGPPMPSRNEALRKSLLDEAKANRQIMEQIRQEKALLWNEPEPGESVHSALKKKRKKKKNLSAGSLKQCSPDADAALEKKIPQSKQQTEANAHQKSALSESPDLMKFHDAQKQEPGSRKDLQTEDSQSSDSSGDQLQNSGLHHGPSVHNPDAFGMNDEYGWNSAAKPDHAASGNQKKPDHEDQHDHKDKHDQKNQHDQKDKKEKKKSRLPHHIEDVANTSYYARMERHRRAVKSVVLAIKIGIGSALAIGIATLMGLSSPAAAGTITLLTLTNTKRGTISLIVKRFISFAITVFWCLILFRWIEIKYVAFALLLILVVFFTEWLGWESTLSVNALIGMHFMSQETISVDFVVNEFLLLCIGVTIAFILNLFYAYNNMRLHMFTCRKNSEQELFDDLDAIAGYLEGTVSDKRIRKLLNRTERADRRYLKAAEEYAGNFYSKAPECYIAYFEMRIRQIFILENMARELHHLKQMPAEAKIVAQYIHSILPYIGEINPPVSQMNMLRQIVYDMRNDNLMNNRQFESEAIYYHILLSFRDIMQQKIDFLTTLSHEERRLFFRDLRYTALLADPPKKMKKA